MPKDTRNYGKKYSHEEVRYEHPSRHGKDECKDCEHYIRGSPPHCTGVVDPISPGDWCIRFDREEDEEAAEDAE